MEVVSFKCPNCGGKLVFDPNTQNYSCPYCNSEFSQEQIDTMQKGKQPSQESEAADSAKGQEQEEVAVYVCPNCGAEIVTDLTTACRAGSPSIYTRKYWLAIFCIAASPPSQLGSDARSYAVPVYL